MKVSSKKCAAANMDKRESTNPFFRQKTDQSLKKRKYEKIS